MHLRIFHLIILAAAVAFAAPPPTDTLFVNISETNLLKVPVGVWRTAPHKNSRATPPKIILWFHGGMTSGNCQKGLVAGGDLFQMLSQSKHPAIVISPSACKQNHWLESSTIQGVDLALDKLVDSLMGFRQAPEISLVGISDGALGVIAYSILGKHRVKNRLLISSYGKALGSAANLAQSPKLRTGRWLFLQGGSDRLYPSQETLPWIEEFCKSLAIDCRLQFDPQGEHDWSYWQKQHSPWILDFFAPSP